MEGLGEALCNAVLNAPLGMVKSFTSNFALPSPTRINEIQALIANLADEDADVRKDTHAQLQKLGRPIQGILLRFWNHEDLELRNRVRQIFSVLEKGKKKK